MQISDLVLHNKESEGLVKTDHVEYDIFSGIAALKALFLKFCKPFEKCLRSLVPLHRVVLAGDGEASTSISVPGFVVDPKAKTFVVDPKAKSIKTCASKHCTPISGEAQGAVSGAPSRVQQVRLRTAIRSIISKLQDIARARISSK